MSYVNQKCPRCGSESMSYQEDARMGLGGRMFCPECGYSESLGTLQLRQNAENQKDKKTELIKSFDDIIGQLSFDKEVLWLEEWKKKLLEVLEM